VSGFVERLERWHGDLRRAHENDPHRWLLSFEELR
jgi:hypothetical protein